MSRRSVTQTQQQMQIVTQATGSILQRKCACGQHTIAGGECIECRRKRESGQIRHPIQTKLTTGHPGDKYEQEADSVTNHVMRMAGPRLQRQVLPEQKDEADSPLQTMPLAHGQAGNGSGKHSEVPAIVHDALRSPSRPLDPQTRDFMEARFGHDFSKVRVHTDGKAAESAQAVNALAYTVGHDVVFAAERFAPRIYKGQRLIAHELAHVLQQAGPSPVDRIEEKADESGLKGKLVGRDEPRTVRRVPWMRRLGECHSEGVPCRTYEEFGIDVCRFHDCYKAVSSGLPGAVSPGACIYDCDGQFCACVLVQIGGWTGCVFGHCTDKAQASLPGGMERLADESVAGARLAMACTGGEAPPVQAKLIVGDPDDPLEREADRVADIVMRMPAPQALESGAISGSASPIGIQQVCRDWGMEISRQPVAIQRICPECDEELHRQAMEEEQEDAIQAKEVPGGTPEMIPDVLTQIDAMRCGGHSLSQCVHAFIEPRFGYDFSRVRVHTDAKVAESRRGVSALAYTVGQHIAFEGRQLAPQSANGIWLLAHELTNVMQQPSDRDSNADLISAPRIADPVVQRQEGSAPKARIPGRGSWQFKSSPMWVDLVAQMEPRRWSMPTALWRPRVQVGESSAPATCSGRDREIDQEFGRVAVLPPDGRFAVVREQNRGFAVPISPAVEALVEPQLSDRCEHQADALGATIGSDLERERVGAGRLASVVAAAASRRLGVPLDGVEIRDSPDDRLIAHRHGASGLTEGSVIRFAEGVPSMAAAEGRALLGHELVHAAQQQVHGSTTIQRKPIKDTPLASKLRSVSLKQTKNPLVVRQDDPFKDTIDVTVTSPLEVEANAQFTPGPHLSGLKFGFFQLLRPFELYRATMHRAFVDASKRDADLDLSLTSKLRSKLPLLDHSGGERFFAFLGKSTQVSADENGEVTATYRDIPSAPFAKDIEKPSGSGTIYDLSGVAARSFFFTAFGALSGSDPIILATFYWDLRHCERIAPSEITKTKEGAPVSVAPFRYCNTGDCDLGEPGANQFGTAPTDVANAWFKDTVFASILNPPAYNGPGTFDIGCPQGETVKKEKKKEE